MVRDLPAGAIPLTPVESPQPEPYRLFILSSLALAGLAGFVLGIHVPLGRLLGWNGARTGEIIQAHGQVQLLGFAGLFVLGMSLRLMPRFSHSRLQLEGLVIPVWGLLFTALVAKAFVLVWLPGDWHAAVALLVEFSLFLAAAGYLLIVVATLALDREAIDGTSWFFLVGASFFFLQAGLGTLLTWDAVRDGARTIGYLPNTALLYLQLGGFLMAFIGGVSTRAVPTMVGLPRPDTGAKRAAALLACSISLLASGILWTAYVRSSSVFVRLADVGLVGAGLTFLTLVHLSGVFRPLANRVRPASQPHMRLIKLAFMWLAFAGALAIFLGAAGFVGGELPSAGRVDALRHAIALGAVVTLILGMALMILPEFAGERQQAHHQGRLSACLAVFLGTATCLRVLPGLAGASIGPDPRNAMIASAGLLGEVALLWFGLELVKLTLRSRRLARRASSQPAGHQATRGPAFLVR